MFSVRTQVTPQANVYDKQNIVILKLCPEKHYNYYIVNTSNRQFINFYPSDHMITFYRNLFTKDYSTSIWNKTDKIIWVNKYDIDKKLYIDKYFQLIHI